MNIDLLREKLKTLGKKDGGPFFKPLEGESVVRIVPLKGSPDNPFQELMFHYFGNKTVLSPRTYGEPDPIADFSDSLVAEGNLSKEDYKAAKQLSPAVRTYVPVIVRGQEEKGVQFWAFGKTIYEQLLTTIADDDYGDISDIKTGRDIKLVFTPKEKSPTKFADTQMMVRGKPSPLSDNPTLIKKWLDEQPVLMDQFKKWTPEELTAHLNAYLNPTTTAVPETPVSAATTTSQDDGWATDTKSPAAPTPPATVSKDVQDEFKAIFNS